LAVLLVPEAPITLIDSGQSGRDPSLHLGRHSARQNEMFIASLSVLSSFHPRPEWPG
jgi:hypothetical protein